MKRYLVLVLGLMIASAALAMDSKAGNANADYAIGLVAGGNGKATVELNMKDGSKQKLKIPYYQLASDVDRFCNHPDEPERRDACMGHSHSYFPQFSTTTVAISVKKARGEAVTDEESALISELEADSKIYDENVKSAQPVCTMPNSKGQTISTSFMPACSELSKAEIDVAPYTEADNDIRAMFSIRGEPTIYRFKTANEQRKKLRRQNLELLIKWNEKWDKISLVMRNSEIASAAPAMDITASGANAEYTITDITDRTGGDHSKLTVELSMRDGSKQKVEIPYYRLAYELGLVANDFCNHLDEPERRDACIKKIAYSQFGNKVISILVAKARREAVADEESALISELSADSKIYDENMESIRPICTMPDSNTIIVPPMPPVCSELSEDEIDVAPYTGSAEPFTRTDKNWVSEPTIYRFRTSEEQRKKAIGQNLDFIIKWNKKWKKMENLMMMNNVKN